MFYFDAFLGCMVGTLICFAFLPVIVWFWGKVFHNINRE